MNGRSAGEERTAAGPDATARRTETVQLVLELSHVMARHLCAVAGEHGLTPPQVRAVLDMAGPAPMRDLAERLSCDKSHVTGLVDGLEERGLVTRQADPRDRRVKQLVLTEAGERMRKILRGRLYGGAPALSNLTPAEEEQLRHLLHRALHPDD